MSVLWEGLLQNGARWCLDYCWVVIPLMIVLEIAQANHLSAGSIM